ncbi:MAG: type II toxin-antitoxin system RelE/ParE family toxin [Hungatella hathewayi]|uniref:Plasmid stabilization system protein n=1 Tax=Hungatella hathewayi WAL-18680 TaxID=742737 RepID=G5ICV3_9FIRM|nr:hypothetical protein [Hungatella hathewayi]EHI60724.1 hypothetical protein HMPREF9473_01288 [ [Hungatella hathewayi WAL-18680]
MYQVDISPSANHILNMYTDFCVRDNGMECALRLLDSYDEKISFLEMQPKIGCSRLKYIPDKYRVLNFWPHLWFVFQIYEDSQVVKIEYIIDDRQNYGPFLR